MNIQQYQVRLTGELQPEANLARVAEDFARLFNITSDKAEATLNAGPRVIRTGLDAVVAEKYRTALRRIGVSAQVESMHSEATFSEPALAEAVSAPPVANTAARSGLAFRIEGQPDFAFITVQLPANTTLKVEASAMATMDTTLKMKTKLRGGLGRFLTGESLFVNEFTAEGGPGEIGIAPAAPGDVAHVHLHNETIYLQNSAFVACSRDVNLETKWQGLIKGFFSGESLFLIRASGQGDLWFNTYGALIEREIDGDYVVDTGNIVAFSEGLEYEIRKVGGYKSLFFSGEGLVCRFRGRGKVWIQTRGVQAFTAWAHAFRPVQKRG